MEGNPNLIFYTIPIVCLFGLFNLLLCFLWETSDTPTEDETDEKETKQ